jgi:3-oxoacid CoA-transferase subunit A
MPYEVFLTMIDQSTVDNSTEKWLDSIDDRLTYSKWYCGHFHTSKIIDKMQFMFNDFMLLA